MGTHTAIYTWTMHILIQTKNTYTVYSNESKNDTILHNIFNSFIFHELGHGFP